MAVFARVVETGSFTRAAEALGLAKSTVSKQVARLEDRLGARLLQRTTRRVVPTDVGAAFYERCRRIVAEAEEAEQAVTRLQSTPRGLLRVNGPVSFGTRYLAPALPRLLAACPELEIDLVLNDWYVDLVTEGYDVAVRIGTLDDSSLVARRLAEMRLILVASPAYLQAAGVPSHPRDLAGHACLRYAYQRTTGWRLHDATGEEVRVAVRGQLRANSGEALLRAARADAGVVLVPEFMAAADLAAGRLVRVLPAWTGPFGAVHAVWPTSRHLSAKVRAFVDFLVELFDPPPWRDAPSGDDAPAAGA